MPLTVKQELFAQKYIELGSAADAYRAAYSASKMSDEAIRVEGHRLLNNPNVALHVKLLKQAVAKRHELTVDDIIAELEEARGLARTASNPNTAVMVAASMGKAKVAGLIRDKQEISGPDGGPIDLNLRVTFVD